MSESQNRRSGFFKLVAGAFVGKMLAGILLEWWSGQ
jgi:hypothetical protein